MQYKTKGIIIRRRNFGEADRILTIYTEHRGKVSVIAKGVRKPLSKLAGHLELFYLSDLHIAEGKNLHTITGAILVDDYKNIRENPQKINQMYYIAELIDKLIHEHEASKDIFNLLMETVNYIEKNESPLLLVYFELQLLSQLGHKPELEVCAKCRKKLKPENNFWDNSAGVICANCAAGSSLKKIDDKIIKILRLLIKNNHAIINKLKLSKNLEMEIRNLVFDFLRYNTDIDTKSRKFIR